MIKKGFLFFIFLLLFLLVNTIQKIIYEEVIDQIDKETIYSSLQEKKEKDKEMSEFHEILQRFDDYQNIRKQGKSFRSVMNLFYKNNTKYYFGTNDLCLIMKKSIITKEQSI